VEGTNVFELFVESRKFVRRPFGAPYWGRDYSNFSDTFDARKLEFYRLSCGVICVLMYI